MSIFVFISALHVEGYDNEHERSVFKCAIGTPLSSHVNTSWIGWSDADNCVPWFLEGAVHCSCYKSLHSLP